MLLFVSGRCDIPAYYSTWFFNRLKAGFVDVRNPFNPHQISRIPLDEANIDALLFCTKNPIPMLERLHEIPFPFLFHVTFTPYKNEMEPGIQDKKAILQAILDLSEQLGKDRVIIRYDPILWSDTYTLSYHARAFEKLCATVQGKIETIIISFVDMYKNTRSNAHEMGLHPLHSEQMIQLGKILGDIARKYGMYVQTCAEAIDLSKVGISKGLCVERKKLEELCGHSLDHIKDKGVRSTCACLATVDIGDYNCCAHGCRYCYANYDEASITRRMRLHDPQSSVLLGHIGEDDHITIRKEKPSRLLYDEKIV